jgi:hypothetical protein
MVSHYAAALTWEARQMDGRLLARRAAVLRRESMATLAVTLMRTGLTGFIALGGGIATPVAMNAWRVAAGDLAPVALFMTLFLAREAFRPLPARTCCCASGIRRKARCASAASTCARFPSPLCRLVTAVPQDVHLFNETVADDIRRRRAALRRRAPTHRDRPRDPLRCADHHPRRGGLEPRRGERARVACGHD